MFKMHMLPFQPLVVKEGESFIVSTYWRGVGMARTIPKDDLKGLIKESIRAVLREERLGLCEIMIPHVSKKELSEIHAKFGSPTEYGEDDFTDMTDWVKG